MAYLTVRIKPTTIDKVVSLMNKLEKYDIVESVESHNDPSVQAYIGYWPCPQCGYQNENAIQLCNSCHTPRPKPE